MRLGSPIGAYRVAEVDDEVRYRLVGPCGTQHRALSLALTALLIHSRDRRTARRYVNAFRDFLNAVEVKHAGAADAFIAGVHDCRRTIDRYLVAMSARTRDVGGGSRWVVPPAHLHRRVADALVAVGKVTRLLADPVFGGQDPTKVDSFLTRTDGEGRKTNVGRNGQMRVDTDRRYRLGSDPTVAPRLEDPRVFDRWVEGLKRIGAEGVFEQILATKRFAGMRSFQSLGLTLHDLFCLGAGRNLPVPNKGDLLRERTLIKRLPNDRHEALLAYVDGERARVTGTTLRDLRLIGHDPQRWDELKGVPLFTLDGANPVTYDRLRRVAKCAAVEMELVLDPVGGECDRPDRYVVLHMLRHEYVHERLAQIATHEPAVQARSRRELIRYMGWRGEGMLRWYSAHYEIRSAGLAALEHNARLDASLALKTTSTSSAALEDALEDLW